MLGFFPKLYPAELLYSGIARYQIRSGSLSPKSNIEELFNSRTITATADLPCGLDALVKQLPIFCQLTSDDFLNNHTLYNFYAPFIPPERASQIRESMKSNQGGNIHTRIGLAAGNIPLSQYFRFCPQCLQENEQKYGEFYWHRIHQLSCVLVCPTHNVPLQNSTLSFQQLNKHHYQMANEDNCIYIDSNTEYSERTQEILLNLARDVQRLLDNPQVPRPLNWYYQQYINLLMSKGIATASKRVNQKKLFDEFLFFYGRDVLNHLKSNIDASNSNWLCSIVRKHRKSFHPIHHILMMRFLCGSTQKFFEQSLSESEYKPFGNAPWICFNGAVDHYLQPVIQDLKLSHCLDNKKPLGTFTCRCGMVYSRTASQSDDYKPNRIITYGEKWHQKLQNLVEHKSLGLRATARELKVDTRTIDRYVEKLGLNASWKSENETKSKLSEEIRNTENDREQNRQDWLGLQQRYPQATKTQLRKLSPALYARLYRYDRQWLNENSPQLNKQSVAVNNRIDWNLRDREVKVKVKIAVKEILKREKPDRVTLRKIGIMINSKSLLEKKLDKLPLTKAYLNKVVESVEMFQERRIRWAIDRLEKQGEEVKVWKVMRLAGIKSKNFEKVEQFIVYEQYLS